jgi:hypothetical protein
MSESKQSQTPAVARVKGGVVAYRTIDKRR